MSEVEKNESEFTERGFQPGNRFVSFVRDVRDVRAGEAKQRAGARRSESEAGVVGTNISSCSSSGFAPTRNGTQDFPY